MQYSVLLGKNIFFSYINLSLIQAGSGLKNSDLGSESATLTKTCVHKPALHKRWMRKWEVRSMDEEAGQKIPFCYLYSP